MSAAARGALSREARRDTWLVGLSRLASAMAIALALVSIARLFDEPSEASVAWALAWALVAALMAFLELAYGGHAARAEERRLRAKLLRRQLELATTTGHRFADGAPARLIQLMTDNAERVTEFREAYLGATIAAMLVPFVTLGYVALAIDPVVGGLVLLSCPLIPVFLYGFMRLFRKTSANSRKQRGVLANRYLDAIRNLTTIRLLGAGERIEGELRQEGEANRGTIMRLLAGNQLVIIVMDGLFGLLLVSATAALVVVRSASLSIGEMVAISLLTVLLLEPLQQVAGFFYIGMGGIASEKAIRAYLASAPGAEGARAASPSPSGLEPKPDLALELRGVRFDHGRGEVLSGVDLEVERGARVAIVGRSGAGKSTLLGLLRGTLALQGGALFVGGVPADPARPSALRGLSATVSQTTWMFTGTIAENLRLAREDASEAEMWEALERAEVADEVRRMPRGLDTHLGEGAALVSGGQAQRVSLARALLSRRPLLLLDEPTSQVDIESEARIVDALAALPRSWTVVVVTHRPSLLRIVDRAYGLEGGLLVPARVEDGEIDHG